MGLKNSDKHVKIAICTHYLTLIHKQTLMFKSEGVFAVQLAQNVPTSMN